MKTIAIFTKTDYGNYGNRLQAYAIKTALSILGYDVYTIVGKQYRAKVKYLIKLITRWVRPEDEHYCRFVSFSKKYLNEIIEGNQSRHFDILLCGSDQIWNPTYAGTDFYFAFSKSIYGKRRISYAASFGLDELPLEKVGDYKEKLNNFDSISVREKTGAIIIQNIMGFKVPVVLDPTLLVNNKVWKAVQRKPNYRVPKKYYLKYVLGEEDIEDAAIIEKASNEMNIPIICLNQRKINQYWKLTGPEEFLWLIDNCERVYTDSFHGVAISISYNKEFRLMHNTGYRNRTNSRFSSLFDMMGIDVESIMVSGFNMEGKAIDYNTINANLLKKRKESYCYLREALLDEQ